MSENYFLAQGKKAAAQGGSGGFELSDEDAAPGTPPQLGLPTSGRRRPLSAGMEAAKTQLGTGLPYGLQKAGIGTLTPEEEARYKSELQASAAKREALLPGGAKSWRDIKDIGDAGEFIGENLAVSAPQMAATVAGTIGGGVAGAAAGTAVGGPVGTVIGAAGGAVGGAAAASPFFVGSNVDRATEGGTKDLLKRDAQASVRNAPAQGALDALVGKFIPGLGKYLGGTVKPSGGVLARAGKSAGGAAVTEGITEVGQQALERDAAGLGVTGEGAGDEYIDALVTGAALGGTVGAASAPFTGERKSTLDPDAKTGDAPDQQQLALPMPEGMRPAGQMPAADEVINQQGATEPQLAAPVEPTPEPTERLNLDTDLSQGAVLNVLRSATADETGQTAPSDKTMLSLAAKLSTQLTAAEPEKAKAALDKEASFLAKEVEKLIEQQNALYDGKAQHTPEEQSRYQAEIDAKVAKLVTRDQMLDAGRALVDRFMQTVTYTEQGLLAFPPNPDTAIPMAAPIALKTEPAPLAIPEPQLAELPAATTRLASDMETEQAAATPVPAIERGTVLDKIIQDPATRNPTRRFLAELAKAGQDGSITPQEAERIARFEDARAAFQDAVLPEPPPPATEPPARLTPAQANKVAAASIKATPERARAAVEAEPAPAQPLPAPPVQPRVNISAAQNRALAHADKLGSSERAWFLRGADHELGISEAAPPAGKSPKARWYESGRAFVREEMAHQERERASAADPAPAAKPAVDRKPAVPATKKDAAQKKTQGDVLKEKQAAKKAEPAPEPKAEPARKTIRGGRKLFEAAVTKAEQDKKITPTEGQQLRYVAEAAWDDGMWQALDDTIKDNSQNGATKFAKGEPTQEVLDSMEKVQKDLRKELDRLGLRDVKFHLTTQVGMYMRTGNRGIVGLYNWAVNGAAFEQIITVSAAARDVTATLHHEAMHALREMNLFTPAEWRGMSNYARSQLDLQAWARTNYPNLDPLSREEEMVAEAYGRWASEKAAVEPTGVAARALRKITDFLKAVANVFNTSKFKNAEAVFKAIERGEIGDRARGPTLTTVERQWQNGLNRRDGGARFRKGPTARFLESQKITATEASKEGFLWFASAKDLATMARDLLPSARKFIALHSRNFALAREFQERLLKIKNEYRDLPGNLRGTGKHTLNALAEDMVRSGKWAFSPSYAPKHVLDPALVRRYNALPPAARNVLQAMFRFNHDARNQLHDALLKAVHAEYDPLIAAATDPDTTKKLTDEKAKAMKFASRIFDTREDVPYSPRKREGQYVVVGRSPEYMVAKAAKDNKLMDKLRSDPDHYVVDFRDTAGQAAEFAKDLETKFPGQAYAFKRSEFADTEIEGTELHIAFGKLKELVAASMKADKHDKAAKELHRLAVDLYLHALTDTSARKGELKSDNVSATNPVTGEGLDMMHAFVSRGEAMTQYIASVQNNADMHKAIQAMREEASAATPAKRASSARFLNQLMWHYVHNLGFKPAPWVQKMTRVTSLWNLLMKPAYYVQNATQAVMLSQPMVTGYLGGNYAKSMKLFGDAYVDWAKLSKDLRLQDRVDLTKAPADVRGMLHQLELSGHLDAGLAQELGTWDWDADGMLPDAVNKTNAIFRQLPQRVEVMNRVVTGMAAYRAALAKTGSKPQALTYARKVIDDTHGDYSEFNTPRAITQFGNFGKIMLQFQKYHLIILGLMAKHIRNSVKGETPEVKNAARLALAFTTVHMGVMAGAVGLPAAGTIFWAANIILNLLDEDDDKDYDNWKEKLRNALGAGGRDTDGDGKVDERNFWGDLLYKGAPYAVLGMDTAQMLGMGDILKPFPYADTGVQGRSDAHKFLGQILGGATGNLFASVPDAWGFFKDDNPARGFESLLPRGVGGDTVRALRFKDKGVTARNGDVLIPAEDISFMEAFLVQLGFPARAISDQQERNNDTFQVTEKYRQKTTNLKRRYAAAVRGENEEKIAKIREEWDATQDARERDGIKRQPLSTLLRAPSEQEKRESRVIGGVATTPTTRGFVEDLIALDDEDAEP